MKRVVCILSVTAALAASILVALILSSCIVSAHGMEAVRFSQQVSDRPVMENVDALREARITGYSTFDFDGVHYVVHNLPEEYLKYSEWKCRVP